MGNSRLSAMDELVIEMVYSREYDCHHCPECGCIWFVHPSKDYDVYLHRKIFYAVGPDAILFKNVRGDFDGSLRDFSEDLLHMIDSSC